ncbi:integrase [Cytobacillus horneckiae]|uniref:site-specific integrase n=1 Tax=Cytobacillus horneckiae TaxID=549687 RepID=UPI0019D0A1D8|nr:site-specific integrase [Cytobacillus horneckiae]MBN6889149.1 site-specific integrase [Cytobacillus horneckiae]
MRGSVRKRGNYYQYRFHTRDPLTNERKEISKGGFEKKKDAEKALAQAITEYENGLLTSNKTVLFKDLIKIWYEEKEETVRSSTLYSYKRAIEARIRPKFDNVDIKNIKPMHIHNFYQDLKKQGLSTKYISYVGVVLGNIMNKAVEMEFILSNPVKKTKKPKIQKKKQLSWTREETLLFLEKIQIKTKYFLTYHMAFYTGMRVGEILGLHWEDIDFEAKMIHVNHTITMQEGEYVIGPVKTDSSDRWIPIGDYLINMLKDHKEKSPYTNDTLVFCTKNKKIVSPFTLRTNLKSLSKELGIPEIRFHDIRRTHTTILIDEGVSPKVVSQRLGHSDVSITLNIYTDVFDERQAEASQKIDDILTGGQNAVTKNK